MYDVIYERPSFLISWRRIFPSKFLGIFSTISIPPFKWFLLSRRECANSKIQGKKEQANFCVLSLEIRHFDSPLIVNYGSKFRWVGCKSLSQYSLLLSKRTINRGSLDDTWINWVYRLELTKLGCFETFKLKSVNTS